MSSKEFHKTRIKELEFQRNIKKNLDNRNHNTLIAILSVTVILLIFELKQVQKSTGGILLLGVIFLVLMWAINYETKYSEDKLIQRNYDFLMGRNNN